MIARLFLIGMVGSLGISMPEGFDWGMVFSSPRSVTTTFTGRRESVAFEPIAVVEDPNNRIADDLNGHSKGLELPVAPIPEVATRPRNAFDPAPAGDSIEAKLMVEFCRIVEAAKSAMPKRHDAPDPQTVSTGSEQAIDELFAENRVWSIPAIEGEPRPSLEPIAVKETGTDLADALNRAWEGIDLAHEPAHLSPTFEPIAQEAGTSDLVDELDSASDGQTVASEEDLGIINAIRLTRNAALAWVNVLTKTMPTVTSR